jgi:transcriptional regulator with XRE-family HTH domain
MSVATRLRAARLARGLTQLQLGEAIGKSPTVACDYEADRALPPTGSVPVLCRILQVSSDWLLGVSLPTPATDRAQADYRERILDAVCIAFDVRRDDVLGKRQFAMLSAARHAAMWLMLKHVGMTLADVGRVFSRNTAGGHSSVIYARDRVDQWQDYDAPLWSRVEIALSILGASRAPALAAVGRSASGPVSGLQEGDGAACGLPDASDFQPTLFHLTHELAKP